jgi:hypothetical protein
MDFIPALQKTASISGAVFVWQLGGRSTLLGDIFASRVNLSKKNYLWF